MKLFQAALFAVLVSLCACWDEDKDPCHIGLERDRYSVLEGDTLEVCVEFVSGECPDEEVNVTLVTVEPIFSSKYVHV